jgi:HSP20 family protein
MAIQPIPRYRSRPASPFLSFYRQANRLFEDVFREFDEARETLSGILAPSDILAPSIDVTQNEREIHITAELPGVTEDNVDVSIDDDALTIRAEKRVGNDDGEGTCHVRERDYGTFQRSLRYPIPQTQGRLRAHFGHGVLTVILRPTEQENDQRKIAIDSSPPPASTTETGSESRH